MLKEGEPFGFFKPELLETELYIATSECLYAMEKRMQLIFMAMLILISLRKETFGVHSRFFNMTRSSKVQDLHAGIAETSIFTVAETPSPARQPRIMPQGNAKN